VIKLRLEIQEQTAVVDMAQKTHPQDDPLSRLQDTPTDLNQQ